MDQKDPQGRVAAGGVSACVVVPEERTARRFPRFFVAALLVTLTFGATLGMVNLARLTGTWGGLPRESVWAHGYAQVFGFVALFIMGFASHALPRFLGTRLRFQHLLSACLWLQIVGVLAVVTALLADLPAAAVTSWWVAGASALSLAAALFAVVTISTVGALSVGPDPLPYWMVAGAGWLVITSGLSLVAAIGRDETWHLVMWPAALYGFAGSWIFGVGRRLFPASLGFVPKWPRLERPVWLLYQAGVVAWAAGAGSIDGLGHAARLAGAAALLVAVPAYAGIIGLFRRRRIPVRKLAGEHRDYARCVHAAWAWLFVALAAGPGWALLARARGDYEPALMVDFARHAFTLGFVTMTILAVGGRIVPFFSGGRIWSPRAHRLCFWLLNAAVALRSLEAVVAMGFWPEAWPLLALSGPPAVAALGMFAVNLFTALRPVAPLGRFARGSPSTRAVVGQRRALPVRPDGS